MVRQWQQLFFYRRYSFTEIVNPDFTAIAKGYSIEAEKINDRKDVDQALNDMLNSKGAYLLEVVVEQEENVFPMIETGASVSDIRLN
jgi:acetolactate synthase-1/2/3 large subunit